MSRLAEPRYRIDQPPGKLVITIPIGSDWLGAQWALGAALFIWSVMWGRIVVGLLLGESSLLLPAFLVSLQLAWIAHLTLHMLFGKETIELDAEKLKVSFCAPHHARRAEWQRSSFSLFVAAPRYVEMYSVMAPSQEPGTMRLGFRLNLKPGRYGLITLLGPRRAAGLIGAFLTNEEAQPVLDALWSFWPEKRPAVPPPPYPW